MLFKTYPTFDMLYFWELHEVHEAVVDVVRPPPPHSETEIS